MLAAGLAGCSMIGPAPAPSGSAGEPARTPVAAEPPAPSEPPAPASSRAAEPSPAPAEPSPEPAPAPGRLLVILSSESPAYRRVGDALDRALGPRYEIEHVSAAAGASPAMRAAAGRDWTAAVAIGAEAAELAATRLDVTTVFCQIFDYGHLLSRRAGLYGVEALPPPALQLASYKRLVPNARSIGTIVGAGRAELVEAARRAARELDVELHAELAGSDREVLYRFKRLVPAVDAFWLIPDNDILSPRVLREVLDYARERGVHTIVFNDALLEWGGLISVTSRPDDVAVTVARVLEAVASGQAPEPRVMPLSAVDVSINEQAASTLGLRAGAGPEQRAR